MHTDEVFATQVAGYPSVFAHGMLTMGMTGRMVTDLVGDGRLLSFGGRFTSQVFPGDDLTTTATVDEIRADDGGPVVELTLRTVNQDDREVFSGYATARSTRDAADRSGPVRALASVRGMLRPRRAFCRRD